MSRVAGKYKKLLFIGSGKIASAVACGLVNTKTMPAEYITVYNRNDNKFPAFKKLGINTSLCLETAVSEAEYIFLAVKPNVVGSVLKQLADIPGVLHRCIVVSFAAAVTMDYMEQVVGYSFPIIRTMPSTPILIGEGVLAVTPNAQVNQKDFQFFCQLMSSIAYVTSIEEELMNPIISVQGSSPAYVYLFVKAMLDAAEEQGIDKKTALPLILKTIKGSVSMIEKSGDEIETLICNVASPNGTTLAALNSFEKDDFCGAVSRAMSACTKRADEISSEM
ncbi:MAG: pyrroline-5-carboxylate reductase [Ruminococcaceae bacterium]|nr:pyrroline-5-carboxylate reductase [Oscillospiraceae bacterium]